MSTSGSFDYSATAQNIMDAAYEDIGMMSATGTIPSADQTILLRTLNYLAKQWQGKADMAPGLKLHTRQRVTVFLAKNQQTYLVGPAASDNHATTQYGRTTLAAAEAAGQTTLSITATTDTTTQPGTTVTMTAADKIGIVQTDGTLFWTTIASTGAGPTVVVDDALSVGAASGAYVYWYTSKAQRFPVCEASVLRNSDIVDVGLPVYTDVRQYEQGISNKTQQGDPINLLIEPIRLNTRVTTDYYPQDVTKQLRLTVLYPSEDYDLSTDDIAFPQEWFAALEWELARRSCPKFGAVWTPEMQINYQDATAIARQLNPDNVSAHFQPNREDWQ
jgi:hypothetical protein